MSSATHNNAVARAVHALAAATLVFFTAAWLVLIASDAHAEDDSDSFTVSATVLATCEVSADDLEFGDYNPIVATHLDAVTTLSVTCTNGTPYEVAMSLGDGPGATTAARYMTQGGDALAYVLYRDPARTQLWGGNEGEDTFSGIGDGDPDLIDVFGRVPMQQHAPAGDYEDEITVTVTW